MNVISTHGVVIASGVVKAAPFRAGGEDHRLNITNRRKQIKNPCFYISTHNMSSSAKIQRSQHGTNKSPKVVSMCKVVVGVSVMLCSIFFECTVFSCFLAAINF